jgi:hypothetical protein
MLFVVFGDCALFRVIIYVLRKLKERGERVRREKERERNKERETKREREKERKRKGKRKRERAREREKEKEEGNSKENACVDSHRHIFCVSRSKSFNCFLGTCSNVVVLS